jgi:AraC family transcriptional activator of pobA
MRVPPSEIPIYLLYGEQAEGDPAGFGHIETIAERSTLHDWEISPHRHQHSIQVLIVAEGTVAVSIDGTMNELASPCRIVVPAGAVHGFLFSPGTRGWVLTLGQDFAGRARGAGDPLGTLLARGGAEPIAPAIMAHIAVLAEELLCHGQDWSGFGPFQALSEALLRTLPATGATADNIEDARLARFRQLIETHLREHRPVAFYAASLGMTERTLTRLCQRRIGCTPLEAINRRLTLEARRLLRYTNATVAQVAGELGFADPSYFSRFYARMTGNRPSGERE